MRKALPRLRLYGLYSFVRFLRIAKIYAYKAALVHYLWLGRPSPNFVLD